MRLTTISLHPGHYVFLDAGGSCDGVVEEVGKQYKVMWKFPVFPYWLKKNYTNVIIRHTVQPVDGAPSYITERPPVNGLEISHELQGEDLPTG